MASQEPLVIPNTFVPDTVADANAVNDNFTAVADSVNELIDAGAGIAYATDFSPLTLWNWGTFQVTPPGTASGNSTAWGTAVTAIQGVGINAQPTATGQGSGGRFWIPQYTYEVNASSSGLVLPNQSVIEALGYGGSDGGGSAQNFLAFVIQGSGSAGNAGLIGFAATGAHTSGGVKLQGLSFDWSASTNSTDMAVFANVWRTPIVECNFLNCPVAVGSSAMPNGGGGVNGSLSASIEKCIIRYGYNASAVDYATAIWLCGNQAQIIGPSEFICNAGALNSAVCISIGGQVSRAEHQVIRGIHMTGWNYCVDFADINNTGIGSGAQKTTIADCEIDTPGIGVNIATYGSNGMIFAPKLRGNSIFKSHGSTTGQPLVVVDTNNGASTNVTGVIIEGNTIYSQVVSSSAGGTGVAQNNQYGIQVNSGDAIIKDNTIGNLGNNANLYADGSAAIAITTSYNPSYNGSGSAGYPAAGLPPKTGVPVASSTSGPSSVIIEGNDLRPVYNGANNGNLGSGSNGTGSHGAGPTNYALIISGAQSGNITVQGNNMVGYGAGPGPAIPLLITATLSGGSSPNPPTITVKDNEGYNDQSFAVTTVIPTSGVAAYQAATLGGSSIDYWGPSYVEFLTTGSVTMTFNAVSYTIGAGIWVYKELPNNTDSWHVTSGSVANMTGYKWIGK